MLRHALLAVAILVLPDAATADSGVGAVTRLAGSCTGRLTGPASDLALSDPVFLQHHLATGMPGRLEVTFDDSSRVTLGDNSELTIDRFVYDPGRKSSVLMAVTGAMRFIGALRKPPEAETTIRTPVAAIGARGTDVWAGPIDGEYGILLVEGLIVVTGNGGQQVTLDEPGEGVSFAAPGAAPGPVRIWPADKAARALSSVAIP